MNLDGRRESTNVEDRRGMSGGMKAGLGGGIMGIVIALLAMFMGGGNMGDVLGNLGNMIQVEEHNARGWQGGVQRGGAGAGEVLEANPGWHRGHLVSDFCRAGSRRVPQPQNGALQWRYQHCLRSGSGCYGSFLLQR